MYETVEKLIDEMKKAGVTCLCGGFDSDGVFTEVEEENHRYRITLTAPDGELLATWKVCPVCFRYYYGKLDDLLPML